MSAAAPQSGSLLDTLTQRAADLMASARTLQALAAQLEAEAAQVRAHALAAAAQVSRDSAAAAVISVADAARLLQVGEQTLRENIRRRRVPAVRVGRRILIPRDALEVALATGSWPAQAEGGVRA